MSSVDDIIERNQKKRTMTVREYFEFLVVERGMDPEKAEAIAKGWRDESARNHWKLKRAQRKASRDALKA
jgi:hypothetical protein